jgi:putative transposase
MCADFRKRCKRYDIPGDAHALTFSCFQRFPLFARERPCRWMLNSLEICRARQMFDLWAYVIMPEHIHLVINPRQGVGISTILKTIKQSVSRKAITWLGDHAPRFRERLADVQPNGKISYRFWQRGGGYDRNLRSIADVHEKIDYVHNNPVRRGLVAKASLWPWSSCQAWETGTDQPIAIDRDSVPRLVVRP